jgi:curved DNA-binding protein CbpA
MSRSIEQAAAVLRVAADSDPATVAHAYRLLARATHPDVSGDPDAAQRFATVAAAYRLLADRARRQPPGSSDAGADRATGREPAQPPAAEAPAGPRLGSKNSTAVCRRRLSWPTNLDLASSRVVLGEPPLATVRLWAGKAIMAGPVMVQPSRPETTADNPGTGDM